MAFNTFSKGFLIALVSVAVLQGCGTVPVGPASNEVEQVKVLPKEDVTVGTETGAVEEPGVAGGLTANRITVAAVGDIMLGSDFPVDSLPPYDGKEMLEAAGPVLRSADITVGNLEGVLLDGGKPLKQCQSNGRCYVFRTPSRFVKNLVDAGFDALSLANNHARDFGETGRSATMGYLDAAGILHSGREGDIASWEVSGRKIAFIAFAPYDGSYDMRDIDGMQRLIKDLKSRHDIVIVSFHGGAEGRDAVHVTFSTEFFHGENRGDVAHFARTAVDAGADLVIGHGPHVPRGVELHKERLIVYSLGNFATYQGINVAGRNGYAPIVTVTLEPDGRFVSGKIHSFTQVRPGGPQPDTAFSTARLMADLTAADFPRGPLKIAEDGTLIRSESAQAARVGVSAGKLPSAPVE